MSLVIKKYNDLSGPHFYYGGSEKLWFSPSKWLWLHDKDGVLIPLNGVTGVCKIVDKSEALMGWAKQKAFEKFRRIVLRDHLGPNEAIELFVDELDRIITEAKKADKEELDAAGETGHIAHAWIEGVIKAIIVHDDMRLWELLSKLPEDDRAANACIAAIEWMVAHDVKWLATERHIFSRKFGFAGTMDGLALVSSCGDPSCCTETWSDHLSLVDWKTSNYLYVTYLMQAAAYQQAHEEETGDVILDRWINRLGKDDAEFEPWYAGGRETFDQDFAGYVHALDLVRSLKVIDGRISDRKDVQKIYRATVKAAAKEAKMKIECEGFKKYKGIRAPKCNGGNPCQSCLTKYTEEQAKKS